MDLTRQLMSRIVIWQGDLDQVGSGNILDLDARAVLTTASPNGAEERASVGTGSDIVTRRTHEVRIPVSEREALQFAEFMARDQGCDVQAMLMGSPGAEHWSWREPTLMHVSDPSGEALTLGAREIVLRSRIFRPQIGRGYDLFAPYTWAGTSATRSERLFPVAGPVLADPPSDRVGATATSDGHILVLSDSGAVEVFAEPGLADSAAYARILGASQYDDIAYDAEAGSLFFLDVSAGQVDVLTGYDTLSSETIIGTLPIAFSLDNGAGSSFSVRSTGSDSQQFAVVQSDTRAIDVYTRTISTDTTTLQDTIDAASGSKDYDALAYQGDQLYVQRDAFDDPVLEVYDIEATTPLEPTLVQSYSDPLAQGAILAVDQMVWVMQAGTTLADGYYDHRLQAIGAGQHVAGGWAVPRDASVDIVGTTSGVAQGTYSAYIDLVMPAMGATVQMVGASGELDGLDWLRRPILADQPGRTGIDPTLTLESDVLVSLDVDLDTPWAIRALIDDTDGIPALQVTRTGPGKGVRRGAALASCDERVDQPAWQGLYEVTRFEVSGDAGDQLVLDLAGADTITYIVQDSGGQTVDVVDGPDLSYALPDAGTYDVSIVAQPSFAGVTEFRTLEANDPETDENINAQIKAETLDLALFSDLQVFDVWSGNTGSSFDSGHISVDQMPPQRLVAWNTNSAPFTYDDELLSATDNISISSNIDVDFTKGQSTVRLFAPSTTPISPIRPGGVIGDTTEDIDLRRGDRPLDSSVSTGFGVASIGDPSPAPNVKTFSSQTSLTDGVAPVLRAWRSLERLGIDASTEDLSELGLFPSTLHRLGRDDATDFRVTASIPPTVGDCEALFKQITAATINTVSGGAQFGLGFNYQSGEAMNMRWWEGLYQAALDGELLSRFGDTPPSIVIRESVRLAMVWTGSEEDTHKIVGVGKYHPDNTSEHPPSHSAGGPHNIIDAVGSLGAEERLQQRPYARESSTQVRIPFPAQGTRSDNAGTKHYATDAGALWLWVASQANGKHWVEMYPAGSLIRLVTGSDDVFVEVASSSYDDVAEEVVIDIETGTGREPGALDDLSTMTEASGDSLYFQYINSLDNI